MASKKKQNGWLPLQEGDTVDLVAPGFACKPEALESALRFLTSWGLEPRMPHQLFGRDILCSNDDESRLHHLREALYAEDSRAVWCVRGGYGSIRLIPELMKMKKPAGPPKLFIGLSDITTLHVFLNQVWGWPTVHGPLLDRLGKGAAKPKYVRELKEFTFGGISEIEFPKLRPLNDAAQKRGFVEGFVTGGNLITLQSSIGTKAAWDTRDRIVFFEDIGERGYRVDRVLEHFQQLGLFDRAKAVVFGDFNEGLESDGKSLVPAVLKRFAQGVKIPVFTGVQSGHDVIQRPVPFETPSILKLGDRGTLICQTGVVRNELPPAKKARVAPKSKTTKRGRA